MQYTILVYELIEESICTRIIQYFPVFHKATTLDFMKLFSV